MGLPKNATIYGRVIKGRNSCDCHTAVVVNCEEAMTWGALVDVAVTVTVSLMPALGSTAAGIVTVTVISAPVPAANDTLAGDTATGQMLPAGVRS